MIRGEALSKSYGDVPVLERLEFEIERGERVALLGVNGAGKTTLFRCLLALTEFEGTLHVDGSRVTTGEKEIRRKIGYVPQRPPLFDMSVSEFMSFFAGLRGVPVEGPLRLLSELGMPIEETGPKALRELSGGMLQKALLALALGSGASVLLLDEPTANLDPNARRDLFRAVRDLAADATLLFASHRLDEIELLADRVLVLHDRKVAFDGTLPELWKRTGAAPGLWIGLPHDELESATRELETCPAVRQLRPNGGGVEIELHGPHGMDLLLQLRQRGFSVSDFRTRPPALEQVLRGLADAAGSRSRVGGAP